MTTERSERASWWSRNLWPLVVGAVALVALLGWTLVAIDRLSDDDVEHEVADRSPGTADRFFFGGGGFGSNGVLLGVVFDESDSLVVSVVMSGTPADEAGLRRGDEIRKVDGERVRDVADLRSAIEQVDGGEQYELTIERGGNELTLDVLRPESLVFDGSRLRELVPRLLEGFGDGRQRGRPSGDQPAAPDQFEAQRLRPTLGVSVVQTSEGLQVMGVVPGSAAAAAGVREGDVITRVGGDSVRTIDQLRAALPVIDVESGRSPSERGAAVPVTVLRDGLELGLVVVFGSGAMPPNPRQPPLSVEPQAAEERLNDLLSRLGAMEGRLNSDEFLDELAARLLEQWGPLVLTPPGVPGTPGAPGDATPPPAEFDLGTALAGLDVFSGSVSAVSEGSITLSGSRGAITFPVTEETVFVGVSPRLGGVAAVAVDADGVAVLVVVAG